MEKKRFRQKDDESSSEDEVVIRKKLPKDNEETTIVEEITRQLDGRLPKQEEIVNEIKENREY